MATIAPINTPKFNWESSDRETEWRRFKLMCNVLFRGPLKDEDDDVKCGYLINWMGPDGAEVYSTWQLTNEEKSDVNIHFEKFEAHLKPQTNFRLARFRFRHMKQGKDQSIEAFVAELKLIIKECQYGEGEQHIIDALIFGSNNTRVQAKLLEDTDPNLTLQKAIEKAKSIEAYGGICKKCHKKNHWANVCIM
ncbi:hypothetical protein SNE40_002764 [Patella caerulea]|uniref:Retrotransposon gag domain-containing protein n=1 Tax=Patella caerulea TaxID=87958 RepID=A0AAN8Q061_PATCE